MVCDISNRNGSGSHAERGKGEIDAEILLRIAREFRDVLQFCQVGNTITVRLSEELAKWLSEIARQTGVPVGRLVREQLQRARSEQDQRPYMRLAGKIKGPRDLSTRKGFSQR